jgi:hypothetical protein
VQWQCQWSASLPVTRRSLSGSDILFSGHTDGSQSLSWLTRAHPFVVEGLSVSVILDLLFVALPSSHLPVPVDRTGHGLDMIQSSSDHVVLVLVWKQLYSPPVLAPSFRQLRFYFPQLLFFLLNLHVRGVVRTFLCHLSFLHFASLLPYPLPPESQIPLTRHSDLPPKCLLRRR